MTKKVEKYKKLPKEFFQKERKQISSKEAMIGVRPFDFSDEVLNGKRKIVVCGKEK